MLERAIVFDLDGTLVDSLPDLDHALGLALTELGAAPTTPAETRGFIGHGIPALVARAHAARGLAPDDQPALLAAMRRHYQAGAARLTRPYPGVIAALDQLQQAGYRLGLCTNKDLAPTTDILQAIDLARFFTVVIAGDSLPQRKPDPAPLQAAFAALGPAFLFVGDSGVDAETASRAGVDFALFERGYNPPTNGPAPRLRFDDWAALPDLVASLP